MVNTSHAIGSTAFIAFTWLFAQVATHGIDWETIAVGAGIVITLLGIAWRGGLLTGEQQTRVATMLARMEALENELVSTKAEFHAYRNDLTKVRDMAVISHNDIEHIKAFKQELTTGMRALETQLQRVNITSREGR